MIAAALAVLARGAGARRSALALRASALTLRRFAPLVIAATACEGAADDDDGSRAAKAPIASLSQALDTDSDGLDDAWEMSHFGNLSQNGAGDPDSDGMTNAEELLHGFNPTVDDAFEDADGDRYPNVFEVRGSSDPHSSASIPTATFVVDGAGGGTHSTVGAALAAANVSNGAYQIIAIAPGTYSGVANLTNVQVVSSKPKLLFIGLEGAGKTILDGGVTGFGWVFNNSAVVASLTFRKMYQAIWVDAPGKELRFVDLVLRDNAPYWNNATAIEIQAAARSFITGSTFINNVGRTDGQHIYANSGVMTLTNTAVWSSSSGTLLGKSGAATLVTNHCYVKGQTLTGTGNLAGSTDPRFRSDFRLLWDSPLRAAGGIVAQSHVDMDGETRPAATPDIGADQFNDTDADDLADKWELDEAGDLTTLTSRAQDADGDGLSNELEYAALTKPTTADTDGDGLSDGAEVLTHATNPTIVDSDGDDMPDGWEIAHGSAPTVANAFEDADGDGYPNIFEYTHGSSASDPLSKPTPDLVVDGAGGGM